MRAIEKISERIERLPEAGRIRLGVRTEKAMKAISTFRFTSPHKHLIEQLAGHHGSVAQPWTNGTGEQWETITESSMIEIFLPADAVDTWYEYWVSGGLQRRCDGETVNVPTETGDGWEPRPSPCICTAQQQRACEPITRLNVILPNIDFAGTWRLETKSWNAKEELPGMARIIEQMTTGGKLVACELSVQKREKMQFGKKKKFIVPVLSLPYTAQQMLEGSADVRAIAPPPRLALVAAPVIDEATSEILDADDDIAEAQVVEENAIMDALSDQLWQVAELKHFEAARAWSTIKAQVGYTEGAPTEEQHQRIQKAIKGLDEGRIVVKGINPDGQTIFAKNS